MTSFVKPLDPPPFYTTPWDLYRRERRWRLPDAIQAAVATHHGLLLATRNTRDFDPERDRFVVVPYRS